MRYEHLFRKGFQENSTFFPQRILSWRNQTRIITAGEVKSGKKKKKKSVNLLSIETPYGSRINLLPKGAPGSSVPPLPPQLNWTWLQEMQQMSSLRSHTSFPFDSFPGFAHLLSHSLMTVAPPPPRRQRKFQGPLPTLHFASHLCGWAPHTPQPAAAEWSHKVFWSRWQRCEWQLPPNSDKIMHVNCLCKW